jgi:dipeptidase
MDFTPYSCDTLVALADATKNKRTIFAKNSDRSADEPQPLELYPARNYMRGERLKCTHITIDQHPRTYRVIGSRPWWIWGFEHGVNEHGVAIGNEAAWANVPEEEEDGLIGMDLLRLGLERSKTAEEALGVITDLLEKYGQGGSCAYQGDSKYHNLFLIADSSSAWVLETVKRHWAAKRVSEYGCISNVYGIGKDYDKSSDGLIKYAESMGLHNSGEEFDFSKSFMMLRQGVSSGYPRAGRMNRLLGERAGEIDAHYIKSIMRDHFEGEIIAPRWSPAETSTVTICMHGLPPGGGHTAASAVVEYLHDDPGAPPELAFIYWGCMAPPCMSFYIPVFNTGYLPGVLSSKSTNKYSDDSFWWKCRRLAVAIESNYEKYYSVFKNTREILENDFHIKAKTVIKLAQIQFMLGNNEKGAGILNEFTDICLNKLIIEINNLTAEFEADLLKHPGQVYRTNILNEYKRLTEMP